MSRREEILDEFGKLLIQELRDTSIDEMNNIINGRSKAPVNIELFKKLENFSSDQISILNEFVVKAIDKELHNTLFMIENYAEKLSLVYRDENEAGISLTEISDGLSGELYTEDGWIERFSKYQKTKQE